MFSRLDAAVIRTYHRTEDYFVGHPIVGNLILALLGVGIGAMFALSI